ncbi:hypothetical protein [Burkholderia gladioli]|uniref:hypothetical protein n=1 Tax=Burkholderia gladioli TaxID=28095 RepID=UPI0016404F01|nr:hypothetical protein [Burkholderia gladioli]
MIYNGFIEKLVLKLSGKRPGGLFTFLTGFSPRVGQRLSKTDKGMETLKRVSMERLRASIMNEGASIEEANDYLASFPSFSGTSPVSCPLADLVFINGGRDANTNYRRSIATTRRLDELNHNLANARIADSVDAARDAVRESGLATPSRFLDLNEGFDTTREPVAWRLFNEAKTWDQFDLPMRVFTGKTLFDWLACWDVDFYLDSFNAFAPRPLFSLVAPRLNLRFFNGLPPGTVRRNLVETPTRRLLDVTSTFLYHAQFKRWPTSTPQLTHLAAWANEDEALLAKIGLGERPFPLSKYDKIWTSVVERPNVKESLQGRSMAPFPLYVAAIAFELLLIQRQENTKRFVPKAFTTLGDDLYGNAWEHWLNTAKLDGAKMGSAEWPDVLTRGETVDLISGLPNAPMAQGFQPSGRPGKPLD